MTRKFLEVVVPVAAYQDVARAAARHAARRGIEGLRIVLLPSEKSSSPPFIDVLARRMSAETRAKRVFTQEADWPFFHPQRADYRERSVRQASRASMPVPQRQR
ncbi:MAG: hypothetical protein ACXWC1_14890 [Burkholderiales bacterium]